MSLTKLETSRKLLTQRQVNKLKTGTKVWILWSGGNGPYKYTIDNALGDYARAKEAQCYISSVGKYPLTQVWKVKSKSNGYKIHRRKIKKGVTNE